jgi:hypothetical protein
LPAERPTREAMRSVRTVCVLPAGWSAREVAGWPSGSLLPVERPTGGGGGRVWALVSAVEWSTRRWWVGRACLWWPPWFAQAGTDAVPMVSSNRSSTARHARAACAGW